MKQVHMTTVLVLLAANGCIVSKPRPTPAPSAFYAACGDFSTIVDRCTAVSLSGVKESKESRATGVPWSAKGSGESRGSGSAGLHCSRRFNGEVRCSPEDMDKLMRALQADLENTARQTGATIDESVEGERANKFLAGFQFDYTAGDAHGQIEVNSEGKEPDPKKPDLNSYTVTIKLQEWVR